MNLLNLLLLILYSCAFSDAEKKPATFVVPSVWGYNVEFYDYDNLRFGIHMDKVTHTEAREICTGRNGTMLELTDEDVAEFIARALAESAVGTSSLWVGGIYTPATITELGVWKWISGEILNPKGIPADQEFPMDEPPYWVDRPDLKLTDHACLVTDRNMHHLPLVTGLPCEVKRPFICTSIITNGQESAFEQTPPVGAYKKLYHLYHADYTWQQSFTMCQHLGFQLAIITKQEDFMKLQNRMQRVRPIMENAWVGGAFVNGRWIWVGTNEDIRMDVNATKDAPPWVNPNNITKEGCLLADRHICDTFTYVEARCDRKRSFICQQVMDGDNTTLVRVADNLFVSTIMLTWQEAQHMCAECLRNGTLLQLAFHRKHLLRAQVNWMFRAMTSLANTEIRHVWMNGYLFNETFHWGSDPNAPQPDTEKLNYTLSETKFSNSSESMLGPAGEDGFIIYCPGDFKADPYLHNFKCLNLDRENLKNFFMYGLSCQYKQHFFCMAPDGDGAVTLLQDTCKNPVDGPSKDKPHVKPNAKSTTRKRTF